MSVLKKRSKKEKKEKKNGREKGKNEKENDEEKRRKERKRELVIEKEEREAVPEVDTPAAHLTGGAAGLETTKGHEVGKEGGAGMEYMSQCLAYEPTVSSF